MLKKNMNSACNVVSLQSHGAIRDSDLIINLTSDVESCESDRKENDINKTFLPNEYNFEQDIEKLIEVSKQFQTDYENEKIRKVSGVVVDDPDTNFKIQILTSNTNSLRRQKTSPSEVSLPANDVDNYYFSNCTSRKENVFSLRSSQRNKTFTPKLPNPGPFGTGIIRPSPKKHSCVRKSEQTSVKRGWNIRPYTARYYNFDRTHPGLKLIENGDSIIPKRIAKEATTMTDKARVGSATKTPLLNGLTWHEFFERSNVYSAKSFQSSYGDVQTHTASTQTAISELLPLKLTEVDKIQKHILPQLNIRAECCVQRIPEISIAPNGLRHTVKSNIKLVEIIYGESDSNVQDIEEPMEQKIDLLRQEKQKRIEHQQFQSDLEYIPSIDLESVEVNENSKVSESKISITTSSTKTSSENNGYDSSLEESISLNVSRVSAFTSILPDHETIKKPLKDTGVQTQKSKSFAKHRKDTNGHYTIIMTSSDYSGYAHDDNLQQQQVSHEVKLPTFPTNELIQMVDEIFDTSSDTVNMSCKHLVKETSVQTDIVWENINDLFKQQVATIKQPISSRVENNFADIFAKPPDIFVSKPQTGDTLPSNSVNVSENIDGRHFVNAIPPESMYLNAGASTSDVHCRHNHLKKFKICSCLECKTNIRFSAMNIDRSPQLLSSTSSSSSAVFGYSSKPKPAAKIKLFPSERYKQMKQAQREHFENDPRISKTLKKIYATAKTLKSRNETTSSSSGHCQLNDQHLISSKFTSFDDDVLQPDLYTFSDEMLLFGLCSSDDIQYSSHLLKTESSLDTFTSNDRYCGMDTDREMLFRNKLMCTNSEDSSCNSFSNRLESDLERFLFKDIENSGSDPAVLSSVFSTSSLEQKVNEIRLDEIINCN